MRKYHVYGNLDDVFLQAWNVQTYLHFLLFFHAACKASRLSTLSDTNVPKRFSVRGCSLKNTHNIYESERETDTHIKSMDSLIHSNKCVQTFDLYCLYHTHALIHKIIYADCALTWPKSSAWLQGLSVNMYCIAAIWDTPIACNPEVNHQFLHVINVYNCKTYRFKTSIPVLPAGTWQTVCIAQGLQDDPSQWQEASIQLWL